MHGAHCSTEMDMVIVWAWHVCSPSLSHLRNGASLLTAAEVTSVQNNAMIDDTLALRLTAGVDTAHYENVASSGRDTKCEARGFSGILDSASCTEGDQ